METVTANIEGYEVLRCYEDGTRHWRVFARPVGATWWTKLGYCGHAHETREVLNAVAADEARKCTALGMVK
jgi:hypothetical protein